MLLCASSLQESSTTSGRAKKAEPLAGTPVMVLCSRQDIFRLVLIIGTALCPQALILEQSTCAGQGLALLCSRRPQLLICMESLVEEDTLALISQAKRLPIAPKILLICNYFGSQLFRRATEADCDSIIDNSSADAGTIFQALQVVLNGGIYRDPAITKGPQNEHGCRKPQRDYKLTARERQILQLIVQGCSNREISENLHLEVSTVKTHVGQLLDKLGARDRTQAAVQAIALALVPWPSAKHALR